MESGGQHVGDLDQGGQFDPVYGTRSPVAPPTSASLSALRPGTPVPQPWSLCSNDTLGSCRTTPCGSYRAERNAARAPRTSSQDRIAASAAAMATSASSPQAGLANRSLRPSPWTPQSTLGATAPSAPVVPTPNLASSGERAMLMGRKQRTNYPCDRSGRRTPTPQQKNVTRSATPSPSRSLAGSVSVQACVPPAAPLSVQSAAPTSTEPAARANGASARSPSVSADKPSSASVRSPSAGSARSTTPSTARRPRLSSPGDPGQRNRAVARQRPRSTQTAQSPGSSSARRAPPGPAQEAWPAAGLCADAMGLLAPLREALRVTLGQNRPAATSGQSARAGGASQPNAKDVRKLIEAVNAMAGTLANLAASLQEPGSPSERATFSAPPPPSPDKPCGVDMQQSIQQQTELWRQCEEERVQLVAREAELQARAVDSSELERVVRQLRERIAELEAREERVKELRAECSALRTRIAGLVPETFEYKALEEERDQLLAQARELEQQLAAKIGSTNGTPDSSRVDAGGDPEITGEAFESFEIHP